MEQSLRFVIKMIIKLFKRTFLTALNRLHAKHEKNIFFWLSGATDNS